MPPRISTVPVSLLTNCSIEGGSAGAGLCEGAGIDKLRGGVDAGGGAAGTGRGDGAVVEECGAAPEGECTRPAVGAVVLQCPSCAERQCAGLRGRGAFGEESHPRAVQRRLRERGLPEDGEVEVTTDRATGHGEAVEGDRLRERGRPAGEVDVEERCAGILGIAVAGQRVRPLRGIAPVGGSFFPRGGDGGLRRCADGSEDGEPCRASDKGTVGPCGVHVWAGLSPERLGAPCGLCGCRDNWRLRQWRGASTAPWLPLLGISPANMPQPLAQPRH